MTGPRSHGQLEAELDSRPQTKTRKMGKRRVFMFVFDDLKAARLLLLLKVLLKEPEENCILLLSTVSGACNRNKNVPLSVLGNKQPPVLLTERGSWNRNRWWQIHESLPLALPSRWHATSRSVEEIFSLQGQLLLLCPPAYSAGTFLREPLSGLQDPPWLPR